MKDVEILLTHSAAKIPQYQTTGSAAFDISLVENITIEPHAIQKVRTGLVIKTPKDHALIIASRSSNPLKKGIDLANSIGVLDSDYCGPQDELFILLKNITAETIELHTGDRIAQGLFIPVTRGNFLQVQNTDEANRGGHGSTGK